MAGIPSIIIDQSFGSLGIEMTQAQMKITTPRPQMEVSRQDPEMSVDSQAPEFTLNWKKVRSESGLKPPKEFTDSYAGSGIHIAGEGTKEAAQDGNFLGKVTAKGNRVAQLARHKTIKTSQTEINLSSMPKSMPEVEWNPGFLNINWTRGSVNIDWVGEYMPEVVIDPPFSIEIFLREKPYIKIMVEDGIVESGTGLVVDKKL